MANPSTSMSAPAKRAPRKAAATKAAAPVTDISALLEEARQKQQKKAPAKKAPAKKAPAAKKSPAAKKATASTPPPAEPVAVVEPPAPAEPVATGRSYVVSESHKAALAQGRDEGRAVRNYLTALERRGKRRAGRRRTIEGSKARLAKVLVQIPVADPIKRLHLVQERLDLEAEIEELSKDSDMDKLADEFCKYAKSYSDRKGLTPEVWRMSGVPRVVLERAGLL